MLIVLNTHGVATSKAMGTATGVPPRPSATAAAMLRYKSEPMPLKMIAAHADKREEFERAAMSAIPKGIRLTAPKIAELG